MTNTLKTYNNQQIIDLYSPLIDPESLEFLDQAVSQFRYTTMPLDKRAVDEAIAFLEWLRDDNFTFLGMREYALVGEGPGAEEDRQGKPFVGRAGQLLDKMLPQPAAA